jgi:hypothetical protein
MAPLCWIGIMGKLWFVIRARIEGRRRGQLPVRNCFKACGNIGLEGSTSDVIADRKTYCSPRPD